jgi:3-hexulose-6-phosphate synthase/6-phospho-3-hexuloisomerase
MPELWARCRAIATSTWSDALDRLGRPGVIHGLSLRNGAGCVAGPAVTVREVVGSYATEDFAVGRFLDAVYVGSILVIETGGEPVSTFGGLAAQAAVGQGAAGVVIDGGCRDMAEIQASGLWLCSRHVTPVSGKGRIKVEGINVPVTVCGVRVHPGDCIIGDETGIVCVSQAGLTEALSIAEELTSRDARFAEALRGGEKFSAASARLPHI